MRKQHDSHVSQELVQPVKELALGLQALNHEIATVFFSEQSNHLSNIQIVFLNLNIMILVWKIISKNADIYF